MKLRALVLLFTACAAEEPSLTDEGAEFIEDAEAVEDGKADDYLSLSAREYVVAGRASVTLEPEYSSRTETQRMARVRELIGYQQIAIAWFLNQYLVDKEHEESNADYGGFGAMSKAGDYESLAIARVGTTLTYEFTFEQLLAGRTNLADLLPVQTNADGTRQFTLTIGLPTNAELAELETNHEWYRNAPWSSFDPSSVAASKKKDLVLTIENETESSDAWFDYQRLFADGVLDVDVHFGWDYHAAYHEKHARALFSWLKDQGYRAPVASFDALGRTSGAFTRSLRANGHSIEVRVRIFYGKTGSETDPDTAAGGRVLEADMRESLRTRDVIVYSGHSGPFYGFALANWRMTEEGDFDDSEMASAEMPSDRYQIVVAEGCDTYQIGAAFSSNPAHPNLAGLDVITTTSFSNASSPATVQDFLTRLTERDSNGRHRPRTVTALLGDLDGNSYGFHTMYGVHGIDDNPTLHPYADSEMRGEACSRNADCGELGNLCVKMGALGRQCTAACTADSGCGTGFTCRQIASASSRVIYGRACVPR
jgi:hypothetical protein